MDWSNLAKMEKTEIDKVPQSSGVYLLYSDSDIIYIGKSDNLRGRLSYHLNTDNRCIQNADKFRYMENDNPRELEKELLDEYENENGSLPPCNDQS